jgi:hypothetical protein
MRDRLAATWDAIKTTVTTTVDNIKSTVTNAWENIKSTATSTWDGIKSAIETPINAARDAVSNAIERIKGLFNFSVSWPHIPLPHFSVSGSANPLDWLTQGVPSISIDWYARGGFVTEPTVVSMAGERGGELVWPSYEPYLSRYATAIADAMPSGSRGVDIHDCTFVVRQESDIRRVAVELNTLINRQTAGGIA